MKKMPLFTIFYINSTTCLQKTICYANKEQNPNGSSYPASVAALAGRMCQYGGRFGAREEQLMVSAVRAGAHEGLQKCGERSEEGDGPKWPPKVPLCIATPNPTEEEKMILKLV